MKPDFLQPLLDRHGWKPETVKLESADKKQKATVYRRESKTDLTYNDTLLMLEVDGDVQVFRLASYRPVQMILSGKAPPA